ncbi:MAG: hypothetical protein ACW98X_27635 [Promethearchaeota archaeon]|jgi:hypothetical protein
MPDYTEKSGIKKLTSVGNVLRNPFQDLENVLSKLGGLDKDIFDAKDESDESRNLIPKKTKLDQFNERDTSKNAFYRSNDNLNKILHDLGELYTVCRTCGKESLKDEMISGICFDCNLKREKIHAENEEIITAVKDGDLIPLVGRIGDLAKEIKSIKTKKSETKSSKNIPEEYMSSIIEEILDTVRKDIQVEIKTIQNDLFPLKTPLSSSVISTVPPPPPPPPLRGSDDNKSTIATDFNFSVMDLETLKSYSPEFLASLPLNNLLASLPLNNRNQFNARLRELQLIDRMTSKEKKEYFAKKVREEEKATNYIALKSSLKNLSESENPLFLKMKKQAEKTILTGTGTLGNLGPKKVYIRCHICGKTSDIIEGKDNACKFCDSSLNVR